MCGTEQSKVGGGGSFLDGKFNLWKRKQRFEISETETFEDETRIFKKKMNLIPRKFQNDEKDNISVSPVTLNFKIVKENGRLVEDGDYAPGTFKAVPVSIKELFTQKQLDDTETMTALIECDFKPYESGNNIFHGTTLKKINTFIKDRRFETLETIKESIRLNVNHASHEMIFNSRDWRTFYNTVEGEFTDPDFPPDKESIVGNGFYNGEPRDAHA